MPWVGTVDNSSIRHADRNVILISEQEEEETRDENISGRPLRERNRFLSSSSSSSFFFFSLFLKADKIFSRISNNRISHFSNGIRRQRTKRKARGAAFGPTETSVT